MFILLLFLSNPAPKSSRKPTSGHCISRTELHFWCKYRYNSEILQTKSNIFLKKSQKLAIFCDFLTKINDFGAKSSLFIGVCTLSFVSLFLLRSAIRSSYTLLYYILLVDLIFSHAKLLLFLEKTSIFAIFYQNSADFGVLGNGMTSRMFCIPVTNRISRSKPSPKPA